LAGVFMGYAPGNPFDLQPGPAHNQRIDYWLTINPQRIAGALKLGAPVYESFYVGKFLPYALPVQYPVPIACGGALNGAAATRFSDTTHQGPYHGGFLRIYNNAGWRGTSVSDRPLSRHNLVTVAALRDTGGAFPIAPVELYASNAGIFGMLEGVCYISGFNNIVENTLVIGGVTYVVIQNVWRTTVKKILIKAEFHTVWQAPSGELVDIVSRDDFAFPKTLFLLEPRRKYQGVQVNNVRKALTKDKDIERFIALADERFRIMNEGKFKYQSGMVELSGETANWYERNLKELEILDRIITKHYVRM
jgi:hypothetical protein